ncbi:rhodanese domain-containing protein CG4456 isoform X1 [Drosophila teissieri]|uniref:rhodanese domain-containing protein CG4456 isoform X1 n=2 Tax=Drosophila teissieri TaxID=7243 RepID=UPI001CB9E551|nr:rhodanese domain-containing protein CG4456 isoform X1 [Drosophila teissieri]
MDLLGPAGKSVVIQLANRLKFVLRPINTMATYEQVKDVPNHPDVYLIDVRRKEELQQTGFIPASINIPLDELDKALNLDGAAFKNKYGRTKPEKQSRIIFSCRSGNRVLEAEKIAKSQGYSNVVIYKGSWNEWAQKEGL